MELFFELKVFREIIQVEDNDLMKMLKQTKRLDSFLNTHIAYKIIIRVHIIVASTQRKFFEIKIDLIFFKINNASRNIK